MGLGYCGGYAGLGSWGMNGLYGAGGLGIFAAASLPFYSLYGYPGYGYPGYGGYGGGLLLKDAQGAGATPSTSASLSFSSRSTAATDRFSD
ncbi:hypothetical protein PtA15_6A232 [Puccinia triticina]|uniref:Uncharacterized protein n=1 Tax=Puccinia triticina TaxID=208348 RepID=A0ABY7CK43_9BASI|nr:uncharacterized protein PtA15_6A232 [Puccinia triticina]WAQ85604.1 hypothetical protein PtA15_6A232 [Puccinia triticina]WAR55480.1 hypothetical protein PtB15_6B221 [Puccinia triticina]